MDLEVLKEKYVPGFGSTNYFNGEKEITPFFNTNENMKLINGKYPIINEYTIQWVKWLDAGQMNENDILLLRYKTTDHSTFIGAMECLPANSIRNPRFSSK